jgi:Cof subfamily protein (haloacid dehalogenase superfamily)
MIKLIATDLDGTLLNTKSELTEVTARAIKGAMDKGILFAASSGRFYSSANPVFNSFKDIIIISNNGAWIQWNRCGEVLYKSVVSREKVRLFVKYIKSKYDIGLFLCSGHGAVVDNPKEYMTVDFTNINAGYRLINNLLDFEGEVCRLGVCCCPDFPDEIYADIKDRFGDMFEIAFGGKGWLDIMDKNVSKGHAVEIIQKMYGINPEETLVFGDYYNDIGMFKKAYYSFAMEPAPDDVKMHAKFIAKSNAEDGVAEEINRLCV